jgi:hypothetical protein
VAVGIVAAALVAAIALQLAAPWDRAILSGAAASAGAWRQPGTITHFVQETEFVDPETSKPTRERREVWASYDAKFRREQRTSDTTISASASIFDPQSTSALSGQETSSTAVWNPRYSAWLAETPEGVEISVDRSPSVRQRVWAHLSADPCTLCHAEGRDARAEAIRLANLPPYVAALRRKDFEVVGRRHIGDTPTYVLRAETPMADPGFTEVATVDIDRDTMQPVRYQIQQVQTAERGTTMTRDTMTIRIVSQELVDPETLPADWFELTTPTDRPWVARESFAATETVTWPPPGSETASSSPGRSLTVPPVYDLGDSFEADGATITGLWATPSASSGGGGHTSVDEGNVSTGTPPAVLEVLQRVPSAGSDPPPSFRTVVEYAEVAEDENATFRWATAGSTYAGRAFVPVVRVITLPPGSSAWGVGGVGSVVVERPDATIVLTAPPGTTAQPDLLRIAETHVRRRQ